VPGPRRKPTLAQELDSEAPVDAGRLPGKLIWRGHRRLLSHKRLYIGVLSLLAAIAAARAHSAISASQGALAPAEAVLRGSQDAYLILAIVGILGAILSQALTHYTVYERRVDISRGVLFRKHQMIWLYEVLDIELVQSPLLMLAGTGTLILQTSLPPKRTPVPGGKSSMPQLRAFGPISRLRRLQKELQAASEVERRSMKKNWI
jgi:membrane protein YdbS with pleckstrin-like domain